MNKIAEEITRVLEKFRYAVSREQPFRAYLDRIEVLAKHPNAGLPEKFLEVLSEIDNMDYDIATSADVDRLEAVLEAAQFLESVDPAVASDVVYFEIDDDDKGKILALCQKMRKIIWATDVFDDPHRIRLLKRISAIETQVHEPKGMYDVILAGVVDFGDAAGKFGEKVKPLTDRMREIGLVARKGAREYDKIPAPEEVKRLPAPEDGSTEDQP